ncbi:MAG: class D sortase [Clostridia bacterium]
MKVYIANRAAENIELTDKIEIDTSKAVIITLETNEVIIDTSKEKVSEEMRHTKADDINSEKVENNNIIGYLTIPDILLEKTPIKESTDLTILSQAIGHFTSTNIYEGNVGLASHNSGGQGDYFKNLKNINIGSKIYYQTSYGTKVYKVVTKEKIDETNLNYLEPTKDNRITLITCVKGEKTKRLCVQAIESEI